MADTPQAPSLAELQRQMLAAIRGSEDPTTAAVHLAGDHRLSGEDRLGIYADMYLWRLLEVMRGAFPRLLVLLGDHDFAALAARYLAVHPSRHPSLRFLGDRLAAFMRADHVDPAWAADLAALEWARYDVFDEADAIPLSLEALRTRAPASFAELPVALIPAHRFVHVDHGIETTWRALRPSERDLPDGPSTTTRSTAPARAPRCVLIWRQDNTVYHRVLEPDEQRLLDPARGTTFGAICELLANGSTPETAAQTAFSLLARWVGDGLLAA